MNQWNSGFTADVTVTTTSTTAVSGWTLAWTFPSGQQVTQHRSSTTSQSGNAVTARNAPWNGDVPPGGSVQFGFNGSHSGTNTSPSAFTFNGVRCATA